MSATSISQSSLYELGVPAEVAERLLRVAENLQMMPAVAMQALEIAEDPNCPTAKFAAVIERDPKLTSDVLKMANSALYCRGSAIAGLHQAISRLGFQQCKNLILTSSAASVVKQLTLEEEWIREILWRHSFVTAMIALLLNRTLHVGFQGEEFTAGLLHDFGRILLAVALPERFSELDPLLFDETADTLQREANLIGTNHADVGAWFAMCNRLPTGLVETIRNHHVPERTETHLRLAALIAASDHAANHLQRCEDPEAYDPASNPALTALEISGIRGARTRFADGVHSVMAEAATTAEEMTSL